MKINLAHLVSPCVSKSRVTDDASSNPLFVNDKLMTFNLSQESKCNSKLNQMQIL